MVDHLVGLAAPSHGDGFDQVGPFTVAALAGQGEGPLDLPPGQSSADVAGVAAVAGDDEGVEELAEADFCE